MAVLSRMYPTVPKPTKIEERREELTLTINQPVPYCVVTRSKDGQQYQIACEPRDNFAGKVIVDAETAKKVAYFILSCEKDDNTPL